MKWSANEEDESEHRICFIVGSLATAACADTGIPLHLPNLRQSPYQLVNVYTGPQGTTLMIVWRSSP